jgi:hypothetical protein
MADLLDTTKAVTAKAARKSFKKRRKLHAKLTAVGDWDGVAVLTKTPGVDTTKALRRAKWLKLADEARAAGDRTLATSYEELAKTGKKVKIS